MKICKVVKTTEQVIDGDYPPIYVAKDCKLEFDALTWMYDAAKKAGKDLVLEGADATWTIYCEQPD